MGIIHVMDEQLTNMIAAGEVVDRPVNIVKECVENSLDAGARSIEIEVFEGGISGVIVTDDGCGMSCEDALMAFERHATSKLSSQEDLFNIATMGFRGEALPSIASVARVNLQTASNGQGTRVVIEYGQLKLQERADVPAGTRIEVRGLFEKTPARFKYLKKANYEFSIIADTVNKIALANPDVRFVLKHDGRLTFQSSGHGNLQEIFYQMFGRETAQNALPFHSEKEDFTLSGLAVQPKISRSSKQFIYLSLNGRSIRSWPVVNAVNEAYREFLPKDRYPIVYLSIQTDPQLIDVNVHPNKWEVRISKEDFLFSQIIETIENLFEDQLQTPDIKMSSEISQPAEQLKVQLSYPHPVSRSMEVQEKANAQWNASKPQFQPEARQNAEEKAEPAILEQITFEESASETRYFEEKSENQMIDQKTDSEAENYNEKALTYPVPVSHQEKTGQDRGMEFFQYLKVIGQLKDSYILCENPDGLVVIDQHAAQERANFERLQKLFEQPVTTVQPLMVPIRREVPASVMARLDEINESLKNYGLHFEAFGMNSLLLRALPDWISLVDRDAFLDDLFDSFITKGRMDVKEARRHLIATMACHSSIRFNRKLNPQEMERVILDLQNCENPYHCPHGRPTVITISARQLFKEFERG